MTYPHATDQLPYVIENIDTREELARSETWDGAVLAAETLSREENVNVGVRYEPAPIDQHAPRACPTCGRAA